VKSCVLSSVCFLNQSGGGASVDLGGTTSWFVRLGLKIVVQTDGDFVDVILVYLYIF
jgi:hypothetical protein